MTNLDDRLRDAAASLEPSGEPIPPFKGVRQRARRRRMIGVTGALVVIAAVTFAGVSTTQDRDKVIVQNPTVPTSTTLALHNDDHHNDGSRSRPQRSRPSTSWRTTTSCAAGRRGWDAVTRRRTARAPQPARSARLKRSRLHERDPSRNDPACRALRRLDRHRRPVTTVRVGRRQSVDGGTRCAGRVHGDAVRAESTTFASGSTVSRCRRSEARGEVDNVDRAAFANITPLILVESPTPGQTVRAPLHVQRHVEHVRGRRELHLTDTNYARVRRAQKACSQRDTPLRRREPARGERSSSTSPYDVERAGPILLSVYEHIGQGRHRASTRRRFRSTCSRKAVRKRQRVAPPGSTVRSAVAASR